MTISGLHHAMLTVSDLERSNTFYADLLGLKTFRAIPDDGIAGAKVIFSTRLGTTAGSTRCAPASTTSPSP